MYARVYWYASQAQYGNDLFSQSEANWPLMKEGFEDIVARYPDAWNLNHFAEFACLAKDKAKARDLLSRITTNVVSDAWQPAIMLERCREWVAHG